MKPKKSLNQGIRIRAVPILEIAESRRLLRESFETISAVSLFLSFAIYSKTSSLLNLTGFTKTILMVKLLLHQEISTVQSNLPHSTDYRRVWTIPPRTLKLVIGHVPGKRVKCARKFRGQRPVRLRAK